MSDPWQAITDKLKAALPPMPEITSDPSEWHPLNGPPEMQEWCRAAIAMGASAATGCIGYALPREESGDGTV